MQDKFKMALMKKMHSQSGNQDEAAAQNPSSTNSMTLAMQRRREELEAKRKEEEERKKADEERRVHQNRVSIQIVSLLNILSSKRPCKQPLKTVSRMTQKRETSNCRIRSPRPRQTRDRLRIRSRSQSKREERDRYSSSPSTPRSTRRTWLRSRQPKPSWKSSWKMGSTLKST